MDPIRYTGNNNDYLLDVLKKTVIFGDIEIRIRMWNDTRAKTDAQNKTFHDLLGIFDDGNWHSFTATKDKTRYEVLKEHYKRRVGLIAHYTYFNGEKQIEVKTKEEIPPEFRNKKYCKGKVDSWANATIKQGKKAITFLINDMKEAGVSDKKLDKILDGFDEKQRRYYGL